MNHEKDIQIKVTDKRAKRTKTIRNAKQFQVELENYPDLKANQSIMQLLSQIEETQTSYAKAKINYNAFVEYYNTTIHSFPNNILRKIFKFNDV